MTFFPLGPVPKLRRTLVEQTATVLTPKHIIFRLTTVFLLRTVAPLLRPHGFYDKERQVFCGGRWLSDNEIYITEAKLARSDDDSAGHCHVSAEEVERLLTEFERDGLRWAMTVHSQPDGFVKPSQTDLRHHQKYEQAGSFLLSVIYAEPHFYAWSVDRPTYLILDGHGLERVSDREALFTIQRPADDADDSDQGPATGAPEPSPASPVLDLGL